MMVVIETGLHGVWGVLSLEEWLYLRGPRRESRWHGHGCCSYGTYFGFWRGIDIPHSVRRFSEESDWATVDGMAACYVSTHLGRI